jgi:F1F0 ATPase subunit 2
MVDWISLFLALVAGVFLGIIYFWGLWLTVVRLPASRRPALLAILSFVARSVITMAGFYLAADGQWQQLTVCLLGFLTSRQVIMIRMQPVHQEIRT